MDAYLRVADLPSSELAGALAAMPADLARRVRAMLDADASAALPDLSDIWLGLGRLAHSPHTEPPPPTHIDGLEVTRELGRGAHGVVYEARQRTPDRLLAIKLLHPLSESDRALFLAEAEQLARLEHPNFPFVVHAGEHEGRAWIAMQRVVGQPLDVWASGATVEERLDMLEQLCEAMAFAHGEGIAHRDLKPSNLLVETDGRLKIVDLGLACAPTAEHITTAGTLAYMAPEGASTIATDIYAVGVLGYELLTGQLPFPLRGVKLREASEIKRAPLPALPKIEGARTQALHAVLARATAADPALRYPTMQALLQALRGARRPKPRFVLTTGAAALLGAAVLAWWVAVPALDQRAAAAVARAQSGDPGAAVAELRSSERRDLSDTRANHWLRLADALDLGSPFWRAALAEAWAAAASARPAQHAFNALAAEAITAERWSDLDALVAEAERDGLSAAAPQRTLQRALRRFSPADPILGAWAQARSLDLRAASAASTENELWLAGAGVTQLRLSDLSMRSLGGPSAEHADSGIWRVDTDTRTLMLTNDGDGGKVWELTDGMLQPRLDLGARLLSVAATPGSVILGFGQPTRGIAQLDTETLTLGPTQSPQLGADVQDLLYLPRGRSQPPLQVAAHGPWIGFALVATDGDAIATLPMSGATRLAHLDGDRMVALTGPRFVDPSTRAARTEPGLYVVSTAHGLDALTHTALPFQDSWDPRSLRAVDLDGDGDLDLVAGIRRSDRDITAIFEHRDDRWEVHTVEFTFPLAVLPGDGASRPQIVVRLTDREDAVWLLGSGDSAVPEVTAPPAPTWASRRERLLTVVRDTPALLASLIAGEQLDGIAEVLRSHPADLPAEPLLDTIDAAPPYIKADDAVAAQLQRLRSSEWHIAGHSDASHGSPSVLTPTFTHWTLGAPAQLAQQEAGIDVTSLGGDVDLLHLDFQATPPFTASVRLRLDELEPGAELEWVLERDHQPVATALFQGWGNPRVRYRELSCSGASTVHSTPITRIEESTTDPSQVALRMEVDAEHVLCAMSTPPSRPHIARMDLPPGGESWRLLLKSRAHPIVGTPRGRLSISSVTLDGVTMPAPQSTAAHMWASGRLRAAHEAMAPGVERDMLAVQLGLAPDPTALQALDDTSLARRLRHRPQVWLPWVLEHLSAERAWVLYRTAWASPSIVDTRPEDITAMLSPLPDRAPLRSVQDCIFTARRSLWLLRHAHHDRATISLQRLLEECPDNPYIAQHRMMLAEAQWRAGYLEEARQSCADARRRSPVPAIFDLDAAHAGLSEVCPAHPNRLHE